jgi:hypothetical protein
VVLTVCFNSINEGAKEEDAARTALNNELLSLLRK